MDVIAQPQFPLGCDVNFGIGEDPQSTLIALGPDLSLAVAEKGSCQLFVCDPSSELKLVEVDSPITALGWLSFEFVCVGLSTGVVVTLPRPQKDDSTTEWFFAQFHTAPVASLKLSRAGPSGNVVSVEAICKAPLAQGTLWVAYRDRTLVAVEVAEILPGKSKRVDTSVASTSGAKKKDGLWPPPPVHTRCTLYHENIDNPLLDAVACAPPTPALLDIAATLAPPQSVTLLACGPPPYPIAHYIIGGETGEARGFRHLARQAAHALKVTAVSFLTGALGGFLTSSSSSASPPADAQHSNSAQDSGPAAAAAVDSMSLHSKGGLRDDRREVSRVWLDPSLKYALCADQLGRVMLVDVARQGVVRLWKGVRDAECGWVQEPSRSSTSPWGFASYCAIYSPRRGFVELFAAVHGPKVRTISVGTNARLLSATTLSSSSAAAAMGDMGSCEYVRWGMRSVCCVLRVAPSTPSTPSTCQDGAVGETPTTPTLELLQISDIPAPSSTSPLGRPEAAPSQPPDRFFSNNANPALFVGARGCLSRALSQVSTQEPASPTQTRPTVGDDEKALELDVDVVQDIAEALAADLSNTTTTAFSVESVPAAEELAGRLLELFRRLRTSPGVQDALVLMLRLPLLQTTSTKWTGGECWRRRHATSFLTEAIEWALDADASGLLVGSGDGQQERRPQISSTTYRVGEDNEEGEDGNEDNDDSQDTGEQQEVDTGGISSQSRRDLFGEDDDAGGAVNLTSSSSLTTLPSSQLTRFMRQRLRLMKAHVQVCELYADSPTVVAGGVLPGADDEEEARDESWLTEPWRAEARAWAKQYVSFQDDEEAEGLEETQGRSHEVIPLGIFLTVLEVDSSAGLDGNGDPSEEPDEAAAAESRRTLFADSLFAPLLGDVFAVASLGKLLRVLGPVIGGCRSPLALNESPVPGSNPLFDRDSLVGSLFPPTEPHWSGVVVALFSRWFLRQPPRLLTALVLGRGASSSGVVRFLEALCSNLPASDGSGALCNSFGASSLVSASWAACLAPPSPLVVLPLWEPIASSCATTQYHVASFTLAAVTQEATLRTLKAVEAKTYGLFDVDASLGTAWASLLCRLRCCLLINHRNRAIEDSLHVATSSPSSASSEPKPNLPHVDPLGGFVVHPTTATAGAQNSRKALNPVLGNQTMSCAAALHLDDDDDDAGGEIDESRGIDSAIAGCVIGQRKLLRVVIADRCSLDLLSVLQQRWVREFHDCHRSQEHPRTATPPRKSKLNGTSGRKEKGGEEEGVSWPDPRTPASRASCPEYWPYLAYGSIVSSELSKQISLFSCGAEWNLLAEEDRDVSDDDAGKTTRELTLGDTDDHLSDKKLRLPQGWVPLLDIFATLDNAAPSPSEATASSTAPGEELALAGLLSQIHGDEDLIVEGGSMNPGTPAKDLQQHQHQQLENPPGDSGDVIDKVDRVSRVVAHSYCAAHLAHSWVETLEHSSHGVTQKCTPLDGIRTFIPPLFRGSSLANQNRDGVQLRVGLELLELSLAHVEALAQNRLPRTAPWHLPFDQEILPEGKEIDEVDDGKVLASSSLSESRWDKGFFDYDIPAGGHVGLPSTSEHSLIVCARTRSLAACLAVRIFEDVVFRALLPFFKSQRQPEAEGSRLTLSFFPWESRSSCWYRHVEEEEEEEGVSRTGENKPLDRNKEACRDTHSRRARMACSVILGLLRCATPLACSAASSDDDDDDDDAGSGGESGGGSKGGSEGGDVDGESKDLLAEVYHCLVEQQTLVYNGKKEDLTGQQAEGTLQDSFAGRAHLGEKASVVRELISTGGDVLLAAVAVKPTLNHLPNVEAIQLMKVVFCTTTAIIAVREDHHLRPPLGALLDASTFPWEQVGRPLELRGRSFPAECVVDEGLASQKKSETDTPATSLLGSPLKHGTFSGPHLRSTLSGKVASTLKRQPSSILRSPATNTATTSSVVSFRRLIDTLFVSAVRAPSSGGRKGGAKRHTSEWTAEETEAQALKVRSIYQVAASLSEGGVVAAKNSNLSHWLGWLGAVDWVEEARVQHAFALLCAGGQDDKALEIVPSIVGRTDLVAEALMFVCGSRISLTLEACERDVSGRLSPLLAALDARLCGQVSDTTRARKGSSPTLSVATVNMTTVSHEGTLALLGYVIQAASFRAAPSPLTTLGCARGSASGRKMLPPLAFLTFAEEANEMRELLNSILSGLKRLGQQRPAASARN